MTETTTGDAWFQGVTEAHNRDVSLAQQRLTAAAQDWTNAEAEYIKRGGQPKYFCFSDRASDLSARTYRDLEDLLQGDFFRTPERNMLKVRIGLEAINGYVISSGPYDHTEIHLALRPTDPGQEFELAGVYLTSGYSGSRRQHEFYVSSYGPAFSLANLALNETSGGSIFIAPSMTEPSASES